MQILKRAAMAACLVLVAGLAQATSGAVDAKGCHKSEKIGFHCHPTRVKDLRLPSEKAAENGDSPKRVQAAKK